MKSMSTKRREKEGTLALIGLNNMIRVCFTCHSTDGALSCSFVKDINKLNKYDKMV